MARSRVSVLRVRPDHVLDDIDRLHELFEVRFLVLKERWFPSRDAAPAAAASDSTSLPKPTGAP